MSHGSFTQGVATQVVEPVPQALRSPRSPGAGRADGGWQPLTTATQLEQQGLGWLQSLGVLGG